LIVVPDGFHIRVFARCLIGASEIPLPTGSMKDTENYMTNREATATSLSSTGLVEEADARFSAFTPLPLYGFEVPQQKTEFV